MREMSSATFWAEVAVVVIVDEVVAIAAEVVVIAAEDQVADKPKQTNSKQLII